MMSSGSGSGCVVGCKSGTIEEEEEEEEEEEDDE